MEKNRLLDTLGNKTIVFSIVLFLLSGCASLRIIPEQDPLIPEEHLKLGYIYESKGEYTSAIEHYKKASPEYPEAYLSIGNIYFKIGEHELAEEYYRKAMEFDKTAADAMNNLAWLYYKTGKNLRDAETLVIEAIKLRPDRKEIYRDTLQKIREVLQ
jgi:tetratricopeptide (TPR) repeat protein